MGNLKITRFILYIILIFNIIILSATYMFKPGGIFNYVESIFYMEFMYYMDLITLKICLYISLVIIISLLRIITFITNELEGQINYVVSKIDKHINGK